MALTQNQLLHLFILLLMVLGSFSKRDIARTRQTRREKKSYSQDHQKRNIVPDPEMRKSSNNRRKNITASIIGCVQKLNGNRYVTMNSTCICKASGKGNTAQWFDGITSHIIKSAVNEVALNITELYNMMPYRVNLDVSCEAANQGSIAIASREFLPLIYKGPEKASIEIQSPLAVYQASLTCPLTIICECTIQGEIIPHSMIEFVIIHENDLIKREETFEFKGGYKETLHVTFTDPGKKTLRCIGRNAIVPDMMTVAEKIIEVTEFSGDPPTISATPSEDVRGRMAVVKGVTVEFKCGLAEINSLFLLTFKCSHYINRTVGSEATLEILVNDQMDGVNCNCKATLKGCEFLSNQISVERKILVLDRGYPHVKPTRKTDIQTTENQWEKSHGNNDSDGNGDDHSRWVVGVTVGISLAIILVAVICFLVGYKAGSKKQLAHPTQPPVMLQPSPDYEDLPEREPLQEAYAYSKATPIAVQDGNGGYNFADNSQLDNFYDYPQHRKPQQQPGQQHQQQEQKLYHNQYAHYERSTLNYDHDPSVFDDYEISDPKDSVTVHTYHPIPK